MLCLGLVACLSRVLILSGINCSFALLATWIRKMMINHDQPWSNMINPCYLHHIFRKKNESMVRCVRDPHMFFRMFSAYLRLRNHADQETIPVSACNFVNYCILHWTNPWDELIGWAFIGKTCSLFTPPFRAPRLFDHGSLSRGSIQVRAFWLCQVFEIGSTDFHDFQVQPWGDTIHTWWCWATCSGANRKTEVGW